NDMKSSTDIVEVVIPAKRDKGGRRFGLTRFDRVMILVSLKLIWTTLISGESKFQQTYRGFIVMKGTIAAMTGMLRGGGSVTTLAVRSGEASRHGGEQKNIVLSYEAERRDLLRLQKAFIGVVEYPGMTYNIQNAFHAQGYFGVKATPLGYNLTLLEGHEDGDIEALMDDAKDWLNQWFREIRPWNPKDVDI
ncbi:hypothetical protein A2U01_0031678, partial [Trifolium medium]|nr:hypothetical protein [Trifolium medium]